MAWKKRLPVNSLMDAQVWMPRGERTFCLDHVLGAGTSPVQDAPLSWGRGQPSALPPCRRDQQLPGSQELGPHPTQLALDAENEQGKYHLQLRKKLHPKTLVSCLVL